MLGLAACPEDPLGLLVGTLGRMSHVHRSWSREYIQISGGSAHKRFFALTEGAQLKRTRVGPFKVWDNAQMVLSKSPCSVPHPPFPEVTFSTETGC